DRSVLDSLKPEERRALSLIAAGSEAEREFEAAGIDFVRGVKGTSLYRRAAFTTGPVLKDARDNTIPWVFSEQSIDRAGDVIVQTGWELSNYRNNPVVLWGHGAGLDSEADIPIGRAHNVRVAGDKLMGDVEFAVAESDRAAKIHRLAKAGFVK